jgi:hypothetical protein
VSKTSKTLRVCNKARVCGRSDCSMWKSHRDCTHKSGYCSIIKQRVKCVDAEIVSTRAKIISWERGKDIELRIRIPLSKSKEPILFDHFLLSRKIRLTISEA